jgi:hypothetical protein
MVQLLRSPRLVLADLAFLAVWCGAGAWLPWALPGGPSAPAWAVAVGLDRPFVAWPFLAAVALLFACTLACTWGKRARVAAAWRGAPGGAPFRLEPRPGRSVEAFLRAEGFAGKGPVLFRHRGALWGGWILHVGLLALIAGVGLQQALHDGANFQLVPGERRRLSDPGAVFQREGGPLAPAAPPDLEVGLLEFDPFQHQPGYAPDRVSTLSVQPAGGEAVTARVDRASGVRVGGVDLFQAIPTGLAAIVETPGAGARALHLSQAGPRSAFAELAGPAGRGARLVVDAEHDLAAPGGTGALRARLVQDGRSADVALGQPLVLGGEPARIVGFARWAGFTYARSPGMPLVYAGFALVLAGAALLAFPAGVARPLAGEGAAEVWLARGGGVLARRWAGSDEGSGG